MYVLCRKRFLVQAIQRDNWRHIKTLYVCLETVVKLTDCPFYADKLYMDLIATTGRDHRSFCPPLDFPVCDETVIDKELETLHGVSTGSIFYGVGAAQQSKYQS